MFYCIPKTITQRTTQEGLFYQYVITRSSDGVVSLFINGLKCASGSPKFSNGYELDPKDVTFFRDELAGQNTAGNLRKIKIWSKALSTQDVASYCDCKLITAAKTCDSNIILSGPYSKIKYSTIYANDPVGVGHGSGRLGSNQAWSASSPVLGEWMQFDLSEQQVISGVVTQGRRSAWQWVTSFQVSVSDDGSGWQRIDCGATFQGNKDMETQVYTYFSAPVKARYLRILPISWYDKLLTISLV
jgi:hypothetical protein